MQVITFFSSFYIDRIDHSETNCDDISGNWSKGSLYPLQKYNIFKIFCLFKSKYVILPCSGDTVSFWWRVDHLLLFHQVLCFLLVGKHLIALRRHSSVIETVGMIRINLPHFSFRMAQANVRKRYTEECSAQQANLAWLLYSALHFILVSIGKDGSRIFIFADM